MMPGMDGYAVLERLREQPHGPCPGDLRLTAMDGVENEEKGLELGRWITSQADQPGHRAGQGAHAPGLKHARDPGPRNGGWSAGGPPDEREPADQDLSVRAWPASARPATTRPACISCAPALCRAAGGHLLPNEDFRPALDSRRLKMVVKAARSTT